MADYKDSNIYKKALAGDADAMVDVGMLVLQRARMISHKMESKHSFGLQKLPTKGIPPRNTLLDCCTKKVWGLLSKVTKKLWNFTNKLPIKEMLHAQAQLGLMHESGSRRH